MPSFSVGWYCGYQHGVWTGSALQPSERWVIFLNKKVEEDILRDKESLPCCGTDSSKHSSSELSGFRHSFHINQGRADYGKHWWETANGVKARTPPPTEVVQGTFSSNSHTSLPMNTVNHEKCFLASQFCLVSTKVILFPITPRNTHHNPWLFVSHEFIPWAPSLKGKFRNTDGTSKLVPCQVSSSEYCQHAYLWFLKKMSVAVLLFFLKYHSMTWSSVSLINLFSQRYCHLKQEGNDNNGQTH